MAIKYKVVTKKPGLSSQVRYYPVLTGRKVVDIYEVCDYISKQSSFNHPDVVGIVEALIDAVPYFVSMGDNVRLDGLGTFSVHASSKGKESAEEVTSRDISELKMSFLPDKRIKRAIKGMTFTKVK
ncbi:HU family DNA-binding protein [Reichenbachiella agarivorans]|uniref:HU family DNA-binding protein n=1 Tax=Reichenbachiella agarivorans TaxID=2979464 RepID=A0ABY6CNC8_9BACT|nr:HU family DNA-binding protein [Reichenbachiella agarivorans]UXP32017.1 HU family DNA-binding protein [Reichenbachiella agarivorans]